MSTNSTAVFSEVLSLQVDSSQFAAEMAKVEAIYEASLVKMQRTAEASSVASTLGQQAQSATTAWERFGQMFETQMTRIPARMAAMAIITAVVTPAILAIEELKIGFENLSQSNPDFHKTVASLKDLNTEFASQAAKPFFDDVLAGMEKLNTWLLANKPAVDGLGASFGQFFSQSVKDFFSIFTDNSGVVKLFFQTLGIGLTGVVTVVDLVIIGFKVLLGLFGDVVAFFGKLDLTHGVKAFLESFKTAGAAAWEEFTKNGVKAWADIQQTMDKSGQLAANILGMEQTPGAVVPKRDNRTLADMKSEFADELAAIHEKYDEQQHAEKAAVAEHLKTHQEAAPILKAIINEENAAVTALIKKYKELAPAAKDAKPDQVQKVQNSYDRTGHVQNKTFQNERVDADKAATLEIIGNRKILTDALQKINEADAKAALAIIKKEVADGDLTRQAGIQAEEDEETTRHQEAIANIASRPTTGPQDQAKVDAAFMEENAQHQRTLNALVLAHSDAIKADINALDAHNAAMLKANEAVVSSNLETAKALGNKTKERELTRELIALKLQEADIELAIARNQLDEDAGTNNVMKDQAKIAQLQATIKNLEAELHRASESGTQLGHVLGGDSQSPSDSLKQNLGLDKMAQDMQAAAAQTDSTTRALGEFAAGLEGAVGIMKGLTDAVDGAIAGYNKGKGMGAAGSLLQNSTVESGLGALAGMASKSLGQMVPVIGPMIGQMFGMISGLFQAGIQKLVNQINSRIQDINNAAAAHEIGLAEQIKELQAEERDSINQLGGKKKAGDQLKAILKSLDAEIAKLKYEQQQVITNFNMMVKAASLGSPVMSQWATTWEQINKQVQDYIQAGGSVSTAAEYLNQQLKLQRQGLQDQLNQGNQTAIADALQLNTLEQQKVQMMKDEAATEFGLLNSDSIERRTSNAVKLGTELTKQRSQFAQQILDLNNQIALGQEKIAVESKIFDLNKSVAQLQKDSNALTIVSLNEQLLKYQDMAKLIAATNGMQFTPGSINPNAGLNGGPQSPIPGEPTVAGPVVGTVNVYANSGVTAANAASLGAEIARNIRSGQTTFSVGGH